MSKGEEPSVNNTLSKKESSIDSTLEEPATPLNTNQSILAVTKWLQNFYITNMS
jgi:hypothetical protein